MVPPGLIICHFAVKGSKWRCLLMPLITLGFLLAAGAGLTMIVLASIEFSSINSPTSVYNNTIVALGNVQKFTTRKVALYQEPGNDEAPIPLKFYIASDGCGSLHSKASTPEPETNVSLILRPYIVLFRGYLMPGTQLNYTFCAVSNQVHATEYHVDFYVADILDEYPNFDPHRSPDCGIKVVYNSNLQPSTDCFDTISYEVTRRGPYSVIIHPPDEVPYSNLSLWYSENNDIRVIDTSRLSSICTDQLATRNNPCNISVASREHYISNFCVVVSVGHSNSNLFTSVHVALTDSDLARISFYAAGSFIIAMFLCGFVLLVVLVCWCVRAKKIG